MRHLGFAMAPIALLCACARPPVPVSSHTTATATARGGQASHQHDAWRPGSALSPALASAIGTVFDQGLPDPRGLAYREVDVVLGDEPEHAASHAGVLGDPLKRTTIHAWVLDDERHAVGWNGLVYRITRLGPRVSVRADVQRLGLASPEDPTWQEAEALAIDRAGPLKVAMLARLGEDVIAARLWRDKPYQRYDQSYEVIAGAWIRALFDHAVAARERGDRVTALEAALDVKALRPVLEAEAARRDPNRRATDAMSAFADVDATERLIAELAAPPRRKPAIPDRKTLAAMPPDERLDVLIDHLDEIELRQVSMFQVTDEVFIPELVAIGPAAVDRLIAVVESDQRLARALPAEEGARCRVLAGVELAAVEAISHIVEHNFLMFEPDRDRFAAEIRSYWQRWRGVPVEERWYAVLADDQADPLEQVVAARRLTVPTGSGLRGDPLRGRMAPTVAAVFERRIVASPDLFQACDLARAYAVWDPRQSAPVVARLHARVIAESGTTTTHQTCITKLAAQRAEYGDARGIDDYARWIANTVPSDRGGESYLMFELLWENMSRPAVRRAVDVLFRDGSPWLPLVGAGYNDLSELVSQPLIVMPAFNRQVVAALADRREIARFEMVRRDRYLVSFPLGGGLEAIAPEGALHVPPAGTKTAVRMCDWIAYKAVELADARAPKFELYWPEDARDAALADVARWVDARRQAP